MNASYEILKSILSIYLKVCSIRRIAQGEFPLPAGPKIIAANHAYATDPFHLPFLFREPLHFVMQKSFFANPLFARIFKLAGQIEVNHECGRTFEQACETLARGETVVIFPEGRLVAPGQHFPARTGAVRMALATGASIIPLGMYTNPQNVSNINLRWNGRPRSGKWQIRGTCILNFGEVWRPEQSNVHALTDELMNRIYSLVHEIQKESSCALPTLPNPIIQW